MKTATRASIAIEPDGPDDPLIEATAARPQLPSADKRPMWLAWLGLTLAGLMAKFSIKPATPSPWMRASSLLLVLACSAWGQTTYTLTPRNPVVNAYATASGTGLLTKRSLGSFEITVRERNPDVEGIFTLSIEGPSTVTGQTLMGIVRATPPAEFRVTHSFTNFLTQQVLIFGGTSASASSCSTISPAGTSICRPDNVNLGSGNLFLNFIIRFRVNSQAPTREVTGYFSFGVSASAPPSDSIRLLSVVPEAGKKLIWGRKQTFRARVHYTLLGRNRAPLALRLYDKAVGGNLLASSDFFTRNRTGSSGEEFPDILEIKDFEVPKELREVFLQAVLIDEVNPGILVRASERYPIPEVKLSVSSIEVVQVTQTADNKVPLIWGKEGLVRVFVKQEPADPRITHVFGVARLDGTALDLMDGLPGAANANPDRRNMSHSLNYMLLAPQANGTGRSLSVRLDEAPGEEFAVENGQDNPKIAVVNFEAPLNLDFWAPSKNLTIELVPVCARNADGRFLCGVPPSDLGVALKQLFPAHKSLIDVYSTFTRNYGNKLGTRDPALQLEYQSQFLNWLKRMLLALELEGDERPPDMLVGVLHEGIELDDLVGLSDPPWRGKNRGRVAFIKASLATAPRTAEMRLAHEVGHNLGLRHTNTGDGCAARDGKSNWTAFYADGSGVIHEPGFDMRTRKIVSPAVFDLMTYCTPSQRWLSPFHYWQLMRQFQQFSTSRVFEPIDAIQPLPGGGVQPVQSTQNDKSGALRPAAPKAAGATDYLVVSGSVDRAGSAGALDPVRRIRSLSPADVAEPDGAHCLEFHGAAGKLSEHCFNLSFDSPETGEPMDRDFFTALVPAPPELARVVLRREGRILVDLTAGAAPAVQIVSPQQGARFEGPLPISWTGSHPGGKELIYRVDYSKNGVNGWKAIALDLTQTSFTIDTKYFLEPGDYHFRVTAANGLDSASAVLGPLEVMQVRRMEIASRAIMFGEVARGALETRPLTIRGTGTGPVVIRDAIFSNPAFSLDGNLPVTISAGEDFVLSIAFDAKTAGRQTGTLRFDANDPDAAAIVVTLEATVINAPPPTGGGGGGTGGGGTGGGGTGTEILQKITPLTAAGWPNGRTLDNPPPNAVDGNTSTFTWTTNPNNIQVPSYFGVDIGAAKAVSRIRLFKDNDGGGGTRSDQFKNLTIEYTATSPATALAQRTWTRVTGLGNGYQGAELLTATAVNRDGTVTRDSHNSATSGWASLTFDAVNATGIRIGFSNVTDPAFFNHYKVHEFEAYGPIAGGGGGGVATTATLAVDNGNFDTVGGFSAGATGYYVNRLTPPSYPATLRSVLVFFPDAELPIGANVTILAATNASGTGGPQLTNISFQRTAHALRVRATFSEIPVTPITITSGDFVVGFSALSPPGTFPIAIDTLSGSKQRSYLSSDGITFRLTDSTGAGPGNYGIRAKVDLGGTGATTSTKVTATTAAGWPNGRVSNNLPGNAIDGSTTTFTWTTEAFNNVNPSYLGVGLAAAASINRLRLFKDNATGGPGLFAKNLTIEYTASPVSTALPSRVWLPVSGLTNGFQGTERLNASAVNANGTVSSDSHYSDTDGWASLTFDAVNATGIRVGFSNTTPISVNHFRVYEFEVYGGGTGGTGGGGTGGGGTGGGGTGGTTGGGGCSSGIGNSPTPGLPARPACAVLDTTSPLAASLAGLFLMNEGSGGTAKNLVNSQTAAFAGAAPPTWNTSDPSVTFRGGPPANSFLNAGTDPGFDRMPVNRFTIVAKINLSAPGRMGIAEKNDNNTADGFLFGVETSGDLKLTVEKPGSNMRVLATGGAVRAGQWAQVAVTWDGAVGTSAAARLYVNGVEQQKSVNNNGTGTIGFAGATNQPFRIGTASFDDLGSMNGKMAYMVVYNGRILTPAELSQLDTRLPIR